MRIIIAAVLLPFAALALFAGLPWLTVAAERMGAEPFRRYLAENETVLDLTAPDAGLRLTAQDLDARYVLLGEMHGFALPQQIDVALMTYLQNEGPPRWYLAEMTPREAIAVNAYLAGGDDKFVRQVFDRFAMMGVQWANREFFRKLTDLRAFNETAPADRQIRFVGIDKDRDGDALVLPDTGSSGEPNLADPATAQAVNAALLGVQTESLSRYAAMRARLDALAQTPGFATARFAGLWGFFHATEAPVNAVRPLALWLQDSEAPFAGDVVTINTFCIGECLNMMPATALPGPMRGPGGEAFTWVPMGVENPYFQRPKGISDVISALGTDRAALYRVSGDESPYRQSDRLAASTGYLVMMKPWKIAGTGAQMTDYLLLYRDSAPLHPWSGEAFDVSGSAAAAR